ncbi:ComF family protein [Alkalicoccus halolimnae]|uniref:ComF family protein n=1 Tax=Alkalicoccus halolimnae TaxID=1667239 RepID=A0A5C7F7T2_9BACI|nr:ComF family protein [Alkalicoccus halolimnae]TXF85630.1 ComF family protein [Alkalicoccus halolimnae]
MRSCCLICQQSWRQEADWLNVFYARPIPLCTICTSQLKPLDNKGCRVCGHPGVDFCSDCRQRSGSSEFTQRSLYPYNPFVKDVLTAFKYRGDAKLAEVFSRELYLLAVSNFQKWDLAACIPLTKERLRVRGFNQAELLAEHFTPAPLLERTSPPSKQSKSSAAGRRLNTEHIFSCSDSKQIKGKRILLIDDIYTTGATLHAASEALIQDGASSVKGVTAARALLKNS